LREADTDPTIAQTPAVGPEGFLPRLIHVIRQERPDILHSYLYEANLAALIIKPLFFPATKVVWGIRCARISVTITGSQG